MEEKNGENTKILLHMKCFFFKPLNYFILFNRCFFHLFLLVGG